MSRREQDESGSHTTGGFAAMFSHWRSKREMSKRDLAIAMGFDPSYISHVEAGRYSASAAFARRAETALNAGGAIWQAWSETAPKASGPAIAHTGLVVEDDHAELRYEGDHFVAIMRRVILNNGPDPVTRYLIRVSVDRHPGDVEASNNLYRTSPLTFAELNLQARCDQEPMKQVVKVDRDAVKEVWLCFENDQGRFPLYPGERASLEYSYTVGDDKWGPWFQRAVRLPTIGLSVRLVFPAAVEAKVWGTETSATAEAIPLRTPVTRRRDDDTDIDVFDWATNDPPLNARYRLEWRFRGLRSPEGRDQSPHLRRASDRMRAAGIVQQGDPVLTTVAAYFNLPEQAEEAAHLVDDLLDTAQRVKEHHAFGKGMGLAAPQIGSSRAAAIVHPPDEDADPIVLLNPRVIEQDTAVDEHYEGCLSFFDVRGRVPRPRRLEVAHTMPDGQQVITVFTDALARLVAHEIDHLNGLVYTDRMREDEKPISVEEYRGTGKTWDYSKD